MAKRQLLKLEVLGSPSSKKAIKMKLFLAGREIESKFDNVTSLLLGLDRILKTNKMESTALQSFQLRKERTAPDLEHSLMSQSVRVVLDTIRYILHK